MSKTNLEIVRRFIDAFIRGDDDAMLALARRFEENRFLEAGEERVLQLYRLTFRGRESDIPVQLDGGILWTLSDAKVVSGTGLLNQTKALERGAVGMGR